MKKTGVALVGCGYVADFYVRTLAAHPHLELVGAADREPDRVQRLSRRHGVRAYPTVGDLLDDDRAAIVVNLTNPDSHFEVSRKALEAGRHVYSEKPLAMDMEGARALVALARRRE